MLAQLTSYAAYTFHPGWGGGNGGWSGGGPGWWLLFPAAFWILVIATVAYLLYRRSAVQSARRVAERTLAERYAKGEISDDELKHRRAVLRGRA